MEDENKKEDYEWSEYGEIEHQGQIDLEGKDFLAICIASLQTIFLPLLILIAFLLVFAIVVGIIL